MKNKYAAHIRKEADGSYTVQTIQLHGKHVAKKMEAFLPVLPFAKEISQIIGPLHDLGKYSDAFQHYIWQAAKGKHVVRGSVNHSSAGAIWAWEHFPHQTNEDRLFLQVILAGIFGHHGLFDFIDFTGKDILSSRLVADKEELQYDQVLERCRLKEETLQNAFRQGSKKFAVFVQEQIHPFVQEMQSAGSKRAQSDWHFAMESVVQLILSALVNADIQDSQEFQDGRRQKQTTSQQKQKRWDRYIRRLETRIARFKNDTEINTIRNLWSNQAKTFGQQCGDSGIYTLRLPVGAGKTLTVFRGMLQVCSRFYKDHLFYAAPFKTVLEQTNKEIQEVLKDEKNILMHHSNVLFEEDCMELQEEKEERQAQMMNDWSCPVLLTTNYRIADTHFKTNKKNLRHLHTLQNSVLVLDEVQGFPNELLNPFIAKLNFLSRICHCLIILCTATQPEYNENTDAKLLYAQAPDMIPDTQRYRSVFERTDLQIVKPRLDQEGLLTFIKQHFSQNMLVILNTKDAVQSLVHACQEDPFFQDIRLVELTTYLCYQQRNDIIEGKNGLKQALKNKEKVLCVSTNLIEAGVDISFESVIRSRAGVDSIIQTSGRCNRNKEVDKGDVYLIDYKDENTHAMEELRTAQEKTDALIRAGIDLTKEEGQQLYHRMLLHEEHLKFDYNLSGGSYNLYDLFSLNKKRRELYQDQNQSAYPFPLCFSFRTVNQEYRFIQNVDQIDLILPYRDALSLVKEAEGYIEQGALAQCAKVLHRLQRYTISVPAKNKLYRSIQNKGGIHSYAGGQLLVVDPQFFSPSEGLCEKK